LISIHDASLSAAAETVVGILKKVIVSPAVYARFLESAKLSYGRETMRETIVICLIC